MSRRGRKKKEAALLTNDQVESLPDVAADTTPFELNVRADSVLTYGPVDESAGDVGEEESRQEVEESGGAAIIDDPGVSPVPPMPTDTRHIDDPLITLAEMARRCCVHRSTPFRWLASGLFVAVRRPNGLPMVRTSVASLFVNIHELKRRDQAEVSSLMATAIESN